MSSPTFERDALHGLVGGLRRHADHLLQRLDLSWPTPGDAHRRTRVLTDWPRINLHDEGTTLIVKADVPGVSERALAIALEGSELVLSGERTAALPEGSVVHRRERGSFGFARRIRLPNKVDAARLTASVRDGVLTVRLVKTPGAQPRKIAVRADGGHDP